MIDVSKANSAISMDPNLKKVYGGEKSLKPKHKKKREFSKIRKALKRQKS